MVDFDLRKLSAPLEALRPEVDAAYKRLDQAWTAVASQLSSLPIPCSVACTIESDDYGENYVTLDWRKWKGKKRVCIAHHYMEPTPEGPEEAEEVTPFEEWSAEQRLDMLKHVPALFEEAAKQTKVFVARTQRLGANHAPNS